MHSYEPTGQPIRIDFVSDIACPWCAVGLHALELALARLDPQVPIELHFQPFELNPQMPPCGQDLGEHLMQKYRIGAAQVESNRAMIVARAAEYGLQFRMDARSRIYNTFDAHRLLHWAGELGGRNRYLRPAAADTAADQIVSSALALPALRLKHALLEACFCAGANISDPRILCRLVAECGLDATRADAILSSDDYAVEVRAQQSFYASQGIRAVPSVILDHRHLIQGGQPPDVFEQALLQVVGTRKTPATAAA